MNQEISKGYDVIGRIAILKFKEGEKLKERKEIAKRLLETHGNILTVLEKMEKVKGRLRTIKTRFLAGQKTLETLHKENNCIFKLNVETCYFSPRLSNERLEVAKKIKSSDKVLVMFAGVGPYSIVIAKLAKPKKVVSIELGKSCCSYAKENVKLNKLSNLKIIQGDVKKKVPKLKEKFEKIIMPRPQLKDTFLKEAFQVSKKGTEIIYYDFGKDLDEILEKINRDSTKYKKRVKIEKIKKAGDIAPYKYRWRIDLKVL